jgi:hypothetical protein
LERVGCYFVEYLEEMLKRSVRETGLFTRIIFGRILEKYHHNFPPTRYAEYYGIKIKADEMDWTCSMLGGVGTAHTQF